MTRKIAGFFLTGMLLCVVSASAQTQMQIYGAWHCYSDACSWASVPNMTTFDTDNRWLIGFATCEGDNLRSIESSAH